MNVPQLTYQSFITDLMYTLSTHKQLNTVLNGDNIIDFQNPKVPNFSGIVYPYCYVLNNYVTVQSTNNNNLMSVTCDFILADRFQDTSQTINMIQSNMIEIAKDIIYLNMNVTGCSKPYRIMDGFKIQINTWADKGQDVLAGCSFTVTFIIEQPLSREWPLMSNV